MNQGKVWLVGAGPGAEDLITVKGLRCIQQAQALVFDRLVSKNLLAEAPPGCERYDVGKQANHHPVPQPAINQLLIDCARRGLNVVRLKGGDPYVFGRGGEEAVALVQAGIPVEVVPGISSAIGGLACAGIPVTHRAFASGVHIVTGHMHAGNQPQDWPALARLQGMLVILMGMTQLGIICDALLSAGKPADTPAAVVTRASTPEQQTLCATLATLPNVSQAAGLQAPGLIVIGDVVRLHGLLATGDGPR